MVTYSSGTWSKKKESKGISTFTSRVGKVDPKWVDPSGTPRRYFVDLEDLQTEFIDGLEDNITYGGGEGDRDC